jgi:GTP 3',8-cyclase
MPNEVDDHKLGYHPLRVAEWSEKGDCFPVYVEIGPTKRCNHRCTYCGLDWFPYSNDDFDRDTLLDALDNMAKNGVKSIMYAGEGEPLLHKSIVDFIQRAKNNGMGVSVTSNGVPFKKEMADATLPYLTWLRFSIDAGDRDTYARVHKTKPSDYDKVFENLNYATTVKKEKKLAVEIGVQALLIPDTIGGVEDLVVKVKKAGADNIQIKPYSQHPLSLNKFVVDYNEYGSLESKLMKHQTKDFQVWFRSNNMQRIQEGPDYSCCMGLPFFALVEANANVIPCNLYYGNAEFTYGNLKEQSFSDIWNSEKRQDVIKKINHNGIEVCRESCRLDVINRYLNRLAVPKESDRFL